MVNLLIRKMEVVAISIVKLVFNGVAYIICLLLGIFVALGKLDLFAGIVCFLATAGITVFFNYNYEVDKPLYKRKGDVPVFTILSNPKYIDFHANVNFTKYQKRFLGLVFGYLSPDGEGKEEVDIFRKSGSKAVKTVLETKDNQGVLSIGRITTSDCYVDNGIGYLYKVGAEDEQALLHYKANAPMAFGKQIYFLQEMLDKDENPDPLKVEQTKMLIEEYHSRLDNISSLEHPYAVPINNTLRVYLTESITRAEYDMIVKRVYLFEEYVKDGFQVLEINTEHTGRLRQ